MLAVAVSLWTRLRSGTASPNVHLVAATGTFTLTGEPVTFSNSGNVALTAAAGSFTLTGEAATFAATHTTFDPVHLGATISLSNGNLTATATGTDSIARSTTFRSAGKLYFEVGLVSTSANEVIGVGLINSSEDLDTPGYIGAGNNGISTYNDYGNWYINFTAGVAVPLYETNGQTLCIAADLDAKLIWARVNNGSWNAGGSADPATGVGGQSISAITGPYYVGVVLQINTDTGVVTANFGSTSFAFTAPSGFSAWG